MKADIANAKLVSTLAALRSGEDAASLVAMRRGLEKESLRVTADCHLVPGAHPEVLGASLTHPQITTDFSESQLELITGIHSSITGMLGELNDIHQFVHQALGEDLLWSASMPCILDDDADIHVGQYGTSNIARLKTIYRLGLEMRYGKPMQMISGIHFNFSMADSFWLALAKIEGSKEPLQQFKTRRYFDMIRNFQHSSWLLLYLFGASPAVSQCFPTETMPNLQEWDDHTLYLPYATSLRMGRVGYQSSAQESLCASFNDLESYAASLMEALQQPYPPYVAKGIHNAAGEYQQLNTSLLQIENEFYSAVRPKCIAHSGERPLNALAARGVEYVEVRLIDVNPFLPMGIDEGIIRFLDLFLLQCLLAESPPDSPAIIERQNKNKLRIVEEGRKPNLTLLTDQGEEQRMHILADAILKNCMEVAQALDHALGSCQYMTTLTQKRVHLRHPAETPSGQMMGGMEAYSSSFCKLAMNQSQHHQKWFRRRPLSAEKHAIMEQATRDSIAEQRRIEASDTLDFETYRKNYIEQHFTLS